MEEKSYLELIVKGDQDNKLIKMYEGDQFPVSDLLSALSIWKDDPGYYGLHLITETFNDSTVVSERSVTIVF